MGKTLRTHSSLHFFNKQVNKGLLIIAIIIGSTCSKQLFAQTVERGREVVMARVNFDSLASYLRAHPEPLVRRDEANEEDDDALTMHTGPIDPSMVRMRATPTGRHMSLIPILPPLLPVSPSPTDTFQSTSDNGTVIPPDTHGAVDSNYCVTTINSAVHIQDRTGSNVSSVSLDAFWGTTLLPSGGSFDPRVHYDPYTHRWIIVAVSGSFSTSSSILIGISQTSNPTGSWYLYKVAADPLTTRWLDFPDVGFNNKWITVTGNQFKNSTGAFDSAKVFVFNKANLLAGTSATYTSFVMNDGSFTLCPALTYDATAQSMFLVESYNGPLGYMKIWKITGAVGSESMTAVAFPNSAAHWWYGPNTVSGTYGADFAPQSGTSNKVQTNDDRVDQVVFINNNLWFSHTVWLPYNSGANPTRSAVDWWQTDTAGNPVQLGRIDDSASGMFYAFPSMAVNANNDALIGFSAFSSSSYPSAAYALRLHSDATDSTRPAVIYRHGLASYYKTFSGTKNRWGDYSGACVDPLNSVDFWTIQEASSTASSGSDRWDTWWAHVIPPCSTPASITGTMNVCVSATTTLSDATIGGTWTSGSTGVATIGSSTGVVTGVSAGTSVITYSTGSGCTATATVTVNPLATPGTISGTATVCVGATTTLSASGTAGGTWTSTSTAVGTVSTGGVVTGISSGTTTISYTVTNGCGSVAATQVVTVNPLATPGTISGTATVCVGATTTLSASGTAGGTWTSTSTAVGTVSSAGVVTGISSGTTTISYTVTNGCGSVAATQVVTVNPLATPGTISGTATVCVGATTTLSASGTAGGTWTSTSTAVGTVSSGGVVTGISSGTTTISYTVTNGCGSVAATQVVTVNPLATPGAISGTATVCVGATTTLSASGTAGGTWTSTSTAVGTVSSGGVVTGISSGTTTISYTVTNGCGSVAATQVVTVNPLATPGTLSGTATVCVGATTTLSASGTAGGTWTSTSTAVGTVSSGGVVTGISSGTTTISYTVTNGCGSVAATQVVTVNPLATPGTLSGTATVCVGATTILSASGTAGGTWTSTSTAVGTVSSGGVVTGISSGTTTISYTVTNGCGSVAATQVVTVNPLATPGTISGTATVCVGATTTLSASGTAGGTWTSTSTAVGTVSTGGVVTGISSGTTTISYTVTNGCGSVAATQVVTLNVLPTITLGANPSVTSGTTSANLTYSATTGSPSNYSIAYSSAAQTAGFTDVTGAALPGSPIVLTVPGAAPAAVYSATLTVSNGSCTSTNYSISVTITPGGINITPIFSAGTPQSFSACANPVVNAINSLLQVSDPDVGNIETWTVLSAPAHGSITTGAPVTSTGGVVTPTGFSYTATAGYTGADVFTMQVSDGAGGITTTTITVTVNALPAAFSVTGGGTYCAGGSGFHIGLSNSNTGVNYQLYNGASTVGSAIAGTGAPLDFGLKTAAGTYTVVGTSTSTSCPATMTGSTTITINPAPNAYSVTGGGTYCSGGIGVATGLANSDTGVTYQLYRGTTTVGGTVAGTGAGISFGAQTIAGIYTIVGTNSTTGCTGSMSGIISIVSASPPAISTVTGGGGYCPGGTGVAVGISGAVVGANYQLYVGASPVGSPVAGPGYGFSFGLQTAPGIYTVVATNASNGCTSTMSGSPTIIIYSLPTAFAVTGGGSMCPGSAGFAVGLSNSATATNYQLYRGGSPVSGIVVGTGAAISFGAQTIAGTYTVVATSSVTGCTNNMTGSAVIAYNATPTAYSVTGGGAVCAGGTGVHVGLTNSATGINYQLFRGGSAVGSPLAGTGIALDFGLQTVAGNYTVVATNTTTSCTAAMTGSATISSVPAPYPFAVTGGGNYCSGGAGVPVGLSGTIGGTNYQLYLGGSPVGSPVAGVGYGISFGLQATAGTYTVVATNTTTGCTGPMSGSAVVSVTPLPTAYAVTGGGGYCAGGTGVHVGLANSSTSVRYLLYRSGSLISSYITGTGAALDFGLQTAAGTYTVTGTTTGTSCSSSMSGSATITINALPGAYTVTGGGGYCAGGAGVPVGLSGSATSVDYQLYIGGLSSGSPIAGTGTALSFGLQTTVGTYTVKATNTTTLCFSIMSGSAVVSPSPSTLSFTVTGGGSYCTGGTGRTIGLSGSQTGINYQLFRAGTAIGSPVAGTGAAISFGSQTTAGTYTVVAVGGCSGTMAGSATISVNSLPNVYSVTGGGSYCSGGSGIAIGLSSSQTGVNYQLFMGTAAIGSPIAGTGTAISLGLQTLTGTYTVVATDATTGCSSNMSGSAVIGTTSGPTVVSVTGGGGYCSGGTGVNVGVAAAVTGTNYQLYLGSTPVGSPVAGPGYGFNFGLQTAAGIYTVVATFASGGCSSTMYGSATVSVYPLPDPSFAVTGGGGYCSGGYGVHIGLGTSASGVTYTLHDASGVSVGSVAGTGSALDFGLYSAAGTYTVNATASVTGCLSVMTGSATVTINPVPTITGSIYTVAPSSTITLSGSPTGGIWSSSATSVATIGSSTGVITGVSLGSTYITYTLPTGCFAVHGVDVTATGFKETQPDNSTIAISSAERDIQIVPNPNNGIFTIKGSLSSATDEEVSIEVVNMLGRVIYTGTVIAKKGELNQVIQLKKATTNGIYLLNMYSKTENKVFEIVIER
jgi:uncharacterized protein YjdB